MFSSGYTQYVHIYMVDRVGVLRRGLMFSAEASMNVFSFPEAFSASRRLGVDFMGLRLSGKLFPILLGLLLKA